MAGGEVSESIRAVGGQRSDKRAMVLQSTPTRGGPVVGVELL